MTLSVVLLYGIHPLDLQATAAVPRLNAELLALLSDARPDWEYLAISPQAKHIPGVETVGIELSSAARARLLLWNTRFGRRLYRSKASTKASFTKTLWAEAAAALLAASRPDSPSTVVICIHAEAVLAVRRAMPRVQIVHWVRMPVVSGFLEAGLSSDVAVAPSAAVYRDSWRRLGNQFPAPLWIIPHWVHTDAFHPSTPHDQQAIRSSLGLDQRDFVIAFIDRAWIKGGHVLEKALAAMPPVGRRVVLLSAGEPRPGRRVLAPDREVRNLGLLPPAELNQLYGAADLGVVPSITEESFGMAALEMMASGLPVVASGVGGLAEVIEDGVSGRLVDLPNHVDSWVEAISSLLMDREARIKLGAAARSAVLERFTAKRAREQWSRVFTQLESAARQQGQ